MCSLWNFNSVLAKTVVCDVGGEEGGKKQGNQKCCGSCYQTLEMHVLLSGLQCCEMLALSVDFSSLFLSLFMGGKWLVSELIFL